LRKPHARAIAAMIVGGTLVGLIAMLVALRAQRRAAEVRRQSAKPIDWDRIGGPMNG
jgi:hypothetical protein